MLRLFNRGHLEEPRFVAMLLAIGCEVWQVDSGGKQFRINGHRGHFKGSTDGVVRGIPDLPPGVAALTEYKTHGEKSFIKLQREGVLKAKWEHFIQMQIYMGEMNLPWALYAAVNKNTDEIHMELVQFDPVQYERYKSRAATVVDSTTPPPKISTTPGFHKCKFCDHMQLCHLKEQPIRTCRSCQYVRVEDAGRWSCTLVPEQPVLIDGSVQRAGCSSWAMIPQIKE
jgi:hypothetical protein